jgi:hypothetical protein
LILALGGRKQTFPIALAGAEVRSGADYRLPLDQNVAQQSAEMPVRLLPSRGSATVLPEVPYKSLNQEPDKPKQRMNFR